MTTTIGAIAAPMVGEDLMDMAVLTDMADRTAGAVLMVGVVARTVGDIPATAIRISKNPLPLHRLHYQNRMLSGSENGGKFPPFSDRDDPVLLSSRIQRLTDIRNDVVDVFDADGKPHHILTHPGTFQLLRTELAMGRGGWMAGQRLGVTDIDQA